MKTTRLYTKFREKMPKKAGTYTYTMSMWDPPGGKGGYLSFSSCEKLGEYTFVTEAR